MTEAKLEQLETLALLVSLDRLVKEEKMEIKVTEGKLAQLDRQDDKENKVCKDHLARQAQLV